MPSTPRIIEAKVRRPAPQGLDRPRLSGALVPGTGPGVVVVMAPPGSGKTTLLAQAAGRAPVAAWCTAGAEDRSGQGFLHHVARSLSTALARDLGRPRTAEELLAALDGPLAGRTGAGALLVVDDVHEVAGSAAEDHLAALLRWRPTALRVALGTRRPTAVDTARLQLSDDLLVLDSDALRFRSWEVEELFRVVYGEPLSPEAAAELTRRTGGWAAGLKLFQLATAGKPRAERERAVAGLGGRSRLLRSYLTRTVLDELDAGARRFLLLTSTLGTLTGPVCDALLGTQGSAAVLERLASRQFFTTAAEDGRSYRYHQVLQTLLEGLLVDERGASGARRVYARSARVLEEAGLVADAVRAHVLAEDHAAVARLVRDADPGLDLPGLDDPAAPADDPWLLLARARRLHRRGSVVAAVAAYRRAEALIDDLDLQSRCAQERARAALWLPDGADRRPSPASGLEGGLRRVTVRVGADADDLPPLARALGLLLAGRPGPARTALAHAPRDTPGEALGADLLGVAADALGPPPGPGRAPDAAGSEALLGRLEAVLLGAEVAERPWLARVARGARSSLLVLTGGEGWQVDSTAALVEECRRDGDPWGALVVGALLGAALTARGDARGGAWLDGAAADGSRLRAPVVACAAELFAAVHGGAAGVGGEGAGEAGTVDREAARRLARARARARAAGLGDLEPALRRLVRRAARADGAPDPVDPARPGPRVRVRCLGGLAVEVGGAPVVLPELRPLPRALLMILAARAGQDVHREVLMGWLWPDTGVDAAAHRLHSAASTVRRALLEAGVEGAALQRRGSGYRLVLADGAFDVAELEAALREAARREAGGDLEGALRWSHEACGLYTGDLLPEAGPEEWVVQERERLRLAAASAAYAVGSLALRLRAPADALPAARRAVELDPLRDSAWALLTQVQERMGDTSAAAATRAAHARVAAQVGLPDAAGAAAVSPPAPPRPATRRAPV